MNAFPMTVEYIDSESGELVTDTIWIDDREDHSAELSQPEPNDNNEFPW